jgi:hypothetical protein
MLKPMLLFALSTALVAQQDPAQPVQPTPPGKVVQDGHVMAMLNQMRVARLQQTLGISEDRAKAIAERWTRWDRDFMDRGRQMQQVRAQFNQILLCSSSEDDKSTKLKPLVEQFLSLRQQQEEAKRRFETEILQPLSPAQQARMILLVEDIQTKIRDAIRANRNGGHL